MPEKEFSYSPIVSSISYGFQIKNKMMEKNILPPSILTDACELSPTCLTDENPIVLNVLQQDADVNQFGYPIR